MKNAGAQDVSVWDLVRVMMPARKQLTCAIRKHAVIDQKSPFVLYAVEVESEYSRFVTKCTFAHFEQLQRKLISLSHQIVLTRSSQNQVTTKRLKEVLPRLPTSLISLFFHRAVPSSGDLEVSHRF